MKDDSQLLLEYMMTEGFNPNNYRKILELLQSAPNSISKYLTDNNQYLLSKNVVYSELEEYQIEGANGYLIKNGIFVPKSLENDMHFLHNASIVPYQRQSYNYPTIDEFDSIIFSQSMITPNTLYALANSANLNHDKYFGFVINNDEKKEDKKGLINGCFEIISAYDNNYRLTHETVSEENKEVYLIKKKK